MRRPILALLVVLCIQAAGWAQPQFGQQAPSIVVVPASSPVRITRARADAQTAAVATVVQTTVGAADADYLVAANVTVITATTHSFTVTAVYTNENNVSQTMTLDFVCPTGQFSTTVVNTQGANSYAGRPILIRAKAGTTITVATTGTFTTVTYNVAGSIWQVS